VTLLGIGATVAIGLAGPAAAATPSSPTSSAPATSSAAATAAAKRTAFDMVRSGASVAANCLKTATAKVTINSIGPVEVMTVAASNLPPNADFDLFVTQVPDNPFGISWYQGDLETNGAGRATGRFVGRFSIETFAVAPGAAPAPVVFAGDANTNPAFNPIQMYHLGLWFNSPKDAVAAGCNGATTPFNGEHNAGVQALSTRNFPIDAGPLRSVRP
jgi:hypothetical protein